ncbi:MAG TPA: phosphopentomutase [Armatimonadota bacterium]|jgi:phosphopentomutase
MQKNLKTDMRLIVVVLDGAGIGAMPDAADYGDVGSNTLANTAHALGGLDLPNLQSLGLGNLAAIDGVPPNAECTGSYGVMRELSKGKDTITGHWEMMGIVTERPFPTYPHGFPVEVIREFEDAIGRGTLANYPASGTEIIKDLGEEHMRTGKPIVYTSADSVFQVAAHESVIPVKQLYEMCEKARGILTGEHNVARVIARPFVGKPGEFTRTYNRRDFSIKPTRTTALDALIEAGYTVTGIGKIGDIFSLQGISRSIHTEGNIDSINQTVASLNASGSGIVFSNLVDFDSKYGHRNDPQGFGFGLKEFDTHLPDIQNAMRPGDLMIITADHGVDPTTPSTDHSREMVPLLVWGPAAVRCHDLGTRKSFADIAATITELFGLDPWPVGTSFANETKSHI